jgi:pyruvate dehydrogenase E1 component alpha subunit
MAKAKITKQTYIDWYNLMLRIRRFEEKSAQMYGMQKIRGFLHLYIGQEAIAGAALSGIPASDPIITAYRDHGLAIARGVTLKEGMAELYGKVTGCTQGKGGSMHFFNVKEKFFGGHGIVGGHIPLGAGIAFAEKYNETDNVCFTFLGDGAVRQGSWHEALNMAGLWKLPVVYCIENNGYAMGTAVKRSGPVEELHKLACAFDIPNESVEAMHPEPVHKAFEKARKHCAAGNGPYVLELRTYRYQGHSISDPAKYRTKEELKKYKDKDPVSAVAHDILEKKYLKENDIKKIQEEVKKEVDEAVEFADNSDFPSIDALYEDIYLQKDYPFIKD